MATEECIQQIVDLELKQLTEVPIELQKCLNIKDINLRNNNLVDLISVPEQVVNLNVSGNLIEKLDTKCLSLHHLDASYNKIKIFTSSALLDITLTHMYLQHNELTYFLYFPMNLKVLDISSNCVTTLGKPNKKLEQLIIKHNNVSQLPKFHNGLLTVDFSFNKINNFPELPESVENIVFSNNDIRIIDKKLPSQLITFVGRSTRLQLLDTMLPESLEELDISDNSVSCIPPLPDNVVSVDISNNKIEELPYIPDSVSELNCSDNYITEISEELLNRPLISIDYSDNFLEEDSDIQFVEDDLEYYTITNDSIFTTEIQEELSDDVFFTETVHFDKYSESNPNYIKNDIHQVV